MRIKDDFLNKTTYEIFKLLIYYFRGTENARQAAK